MSGVHARPARVTRAWAACSAACGWLRLRIRLPRDRDGEPRCGLCGCPVDGLCQHECCDPDTGTLPAAAVAELRGQWAISAAEHQAARADIIARHGELPPSLRKVEERGGRFGRRLSQNAIRAAAGWPPLPPRVAAMLEASRSDVLDAIDALIDDERGREDTGHLVPPVLLDELRASVLPSELDRAAEQAGVPLEPLPAPTAIWHADRDLPNADAGYWQPRPVGGTTITTTGWQPPADTATDIYAPPDIADLADDKWADKLITWATYAPLDDVQALR